jgi:hypothetical protein
MIELYYICYIIEVAVISALILHPLFKSDFKKIDINIIKRTK